MKRAELEAEVVRTEEELKSLQATFEADRTRLSQLESDYKRIKQQFILPCRRHSEYCRAIETAVGGLEDVVDGVSALQRRRRHRRQPAFRADATAWLSKDNVGGQHIATQWHYTKNCRLFHGKEQKEQARSLDNTSFVAKFAMYWIDNMS